MRYGFVIDQDACIGCHACTVACKAENDVPVGSFRTNVKYVETGKFPAVKRSFLVQRCNQCTKAPCVTICPVNALTKRPDGIVDIDRDACIGCRACMQACPYDALYVNEDLGAVEKCHFCAHRIEKGLQPACVTVCPVGAIIPGDFDDPESRVTLIRRAQVLKTRRPEQGTGPNVFYIGADSAALNPGSAARPRHYIWSQRKNTKPELWPAEVPVQTDAKEVLNADPKIEWGWAVGLYLLTKGIAGGAAMVAPFLGANVPWWAPETIALVFTLVTVFLLIEDLKKPMHFYKLFTRPNWDSWLVKGGIVLTAFGGVSALILICKFFQSPQDSGRFTLGIVSESGLGYTRTYVDGLAWFGNNLRWLNVVVGAMTAGYTAFLFKQCKGRDLWEAEGLLWDLLAQSLTAGAAVCLLVGIANWVTVGALFLGAFAFVALHFVPVTEKDRTENYKQAAGFFHEMTFSGISVGSQLPFVVLAFAALALGDLAIGVATSIIQPVLAALVLVFLFGYERAFVRAGQLPPLS